MGLFDFFTSRAATPIAAPENLQADGSMCEFRDALVREVVGQRGLLERDASANPPVAELRLLNENLALLEIVCETQAGDDLGRAIKGVLQESGAEKIELIRELRERDEPETRQFLRRMIQLDPEVEVRKAATSALLYNADEDERGFLRDLFQSESAAEVREVAIFAFDPEGHPEDRSFLLNQFEQLPPGLRLAALDVLMAAAQEPEVEEFLAAQDGFSEEESEFVEER